MDSKNIRRYYNHLNTQHCMQKMITPCLVIYVIMIFIRMDDSFSYKRLKKSWKDGVLNKS